MKKNWPLVALGILFAAIVLVSCYTYPSGQPKQGGASQTSPSMTAPPNNAGNSSNETQNPESSKHWVNIFAWPQGVTALAIIFTLFFIAWQATLMRQAVLGSEEASKRELRAYLTTLIGDAIYQERRSEADGGDLKFQVNPVLKNTGKTPARKIRFKARAAILPLPLPKETHLPEGFDQDTGDSILGAGHNASMTAVVDGFCQDSEVQDIKDGGFRSKRALYVWGLVTYEDMFGEAHFTRFCHYIYWLKDGKVMGKYWPGRNDAD